LAGDSRDLRAALVAFALVSVAIAGFVRLDVTVPFLGHLGSALVAVLLLYAPVFYAWRRDEDLASYGFCLEPLRRGLILGLGFTVVVFPLFTAGYLFFYDLVCESSGALRDLAPPGMCPRFLGWAGLHAPVLDGDFTQFALVQLVVVALPEELFFRGFLHHLLERALPPRRRILGGGIGLALVISSLLFALVHLPKYGDPRSLATFFPALVFGWMRSATGSIFAGTVAHASSNLFVRMLDDMFLR
jgi:membrane protease YdiL (CAAX protease family)